MRRAKTVSLLLALSCLMFTSSAWADGFVLTGSKWEPGPGSASFFNPATPPGTPGSATWSLMPADIPIAYGDLPPYTAPDHSFGFLSDSMVGLTELPDVGGVPYEIWAINDALNIWDAVSGFTNLGQVADGVSNGADGCDNVYNGCVDVGDIRIGAYPFNISLDGHVILGHSFQPGTSALDPPYGSIGGDTHFNNDKNGTYPNQLTWVDHAYDPSGDPTYDFYTVVLHEMGHALGLDHSTDPNSVMALYHGGLRTLTADDIAGIQAIYGPQDETPVIPEPGTLTLLGLGLGGRALAAWRRRK